MTEDSAPSSSAGGTSQTNGPASGSNEQPWWHAMTEDSETPNPIEVGTAAQEAVKLAGAVAQWAEQSGLADVLKGIAEQAADSVKAAARSASGATDGASSGAEGDAGESTAHVPVTCDSCPICQGVEMVKTMSPEAADGLTDALAAVTSAVRQAVDTFGGSAGSSESRVEHIDID